MRQAGSRDTLPYWLAAFAAWGAVFAYLLSSHGHLDFADHAVGRDFVNTWTAGKLLGQGQVAEIFEPRTFADAHHRFFDPKLPFHFWSYPPPALFLAAPMGLLPYLPALAIWSALGLIALAASVLTVFKSPAERALILLSPATAVNLVMGQNGAFTAALLIGGLGLTMRRPIVAGMLFGLLVFKPQLGVVLPVVVIATRQWRTLLAAASTAALVIALSAATFGLEAWHGFLGPTLDMQTAAMMRGEGPFLLMMPSAFAAGRIFGLHGEAIWLQAPFLLGAIAIVWSVWRGDAPFETRVAATLMAALAATPQSFNYDLIPTAAAAVVLARYTGPANRWLGWGVWFLPLAVVAFNAVHLPIGNLILIGAAWRLSRPGALAQEPHKSSSA